MDYRSRSDEAVIIDTPGTVKDAADGSPSAPNIIGNRRTFPTTVFLQCCHWGSASTTKVAVFRLPKWPVYAFGISQPNHSAFQRYFDRQSFYFDNPRSTHLHQLWWISYLHHFSPQTLSSRSQTHDIKQFVSADSKNYRNQSDHHNEIYYSWKKFIWSSLKLLIN